MIKNDKLKEIRLEFNHSQSETAHLLQVSRSSYAMWESGNELFPIKRLLEFCEFYKCSLDYIFNFKESNYERLESYCPVKCLVRLKEFRKENKLSQEKLAKILNTNKSVICNYEKGRYIIATPFLYTICKKYHISADYLLGKIDEPKYLK